MAKMFKPKDRVTVNDPGSPDHGKQGTVESYDPDTDTCSVLIDGEKVAKELGCDKLTAKP